MFLLRSLVVLGLVLGLTSVAEAAKPKKKAAAGTLRGIVKEIQTNKDNTSTATLTVQAVVGKKKKGAPAPAGETKKITVNADTKFEKVEAPAKGQKKLPLTGQPAKLSDLQVDSRVLVTLKSGTENVAEKVQIVPAKKKAKKKATNS